MTRNGFTLIELLVALLIGSLVLAALSWATATLIAQLTRTASRDDATDRALATLRQLIEQAQVPSATAPLVQEDDRFELSVTAPQALAAPGAVRLVLRVEGARGQQRLVAAFGEGAGDAKGEARQALLLDHLREARFDYGPPLVRAVPALPSFVALRFTDARGPHLLVAAPRRTAGSACRFDPISQECRP